MIIDEHKHEMNRTVSLPDGRFVITCSICEKTKETLVDERIESIEGAIFELNEVMMNFSRQMQILNLRFQAFADMVTAYAKGAAEDMDAFNQLDGRAPSGNTEIKEE